MISPKLVTARLKLDNAIKEVEETHAIWSDLTASIHMAELNWRLAQKRMRDAYNSVFDVLNGDLSSIERERGVTKP